LADDVDQRLITADEMKSIDWAFQWFHKGQGDITGADGGAEQNDSLSSDDGMKDLGILNKNGVFQQDIMEAALLFIQDQKVGGEPDFYSLQKHLHEFFPDKVPLTGKNKPIEGSEDSEDIDL